VRSGENVSAPENPTVDTSFISMHIQEWASVCRMIESSIKRQEAVVLVPRRLSEVADFRKSLLNQEIIVVDWPKVQKGAVSIVSQFGVTKDVFAVSKSAVVGGSFARGLGVHDFWEPLQRGVATCVGPYAEGQKETVATLVREGVIAQLQSTDGFSQRNKPDVRLVQTFLAHESAKISDSYQQLIEFLKNLLK
jgi:3-deoxy-D-manno-octulosonic-acid transferase